MDSKFSEQLDKILALADSAHDGEAVVAIRKARVLLSRAGLSFADLARGFEAGRSRLGLLSKKPKQTDVDALRDQLSHIQKQAHIYSAQASVWRQRVAELEQTLNERKIEAERWRQLAHDTLEKLWDAGVRGIGVQGKLAEPKGEDEFSRKTPAVPPV